MSDSSNGVNETQPAKTKGKPWFFIGIIGGILGGALIDNMGAGVAIGISLWLIMSFVEKKRQTGESEAVDEPKQEAGE